MARDGSQIYSPPAGTLATPGTTIESAKYNAFVNDIAADQNTARPIVAGGTGATTAGAARTNLGLVIGTNVQAQDPFLQDIADLTAPSDGRLLGWNTATSEVAFLDTGIGVTGNAPTLVSINATGLASGIYRWDAATTGSFPPPFNAATTGLVRFDRQAAAQGMMTARPAGENRVFVRFLTATVWGVWFEIPAMTDPGAQRVLGWDDTANTFAWFSAGSGISLASNAVAATGTYSTATAVAMSGASVTITASVPSTANVVRVGLRGMSTNGSAITLLRVGAGSVLSTGYDGATDRASGGTTTDTTGFPLASPIAAANVWVGEYTLCRQDNDWWFCNGTTRRGDGVTWAVTGTINVPGGINRVVVNGNGDSFDAGTAYVSWE